MNFKIKIVQVIPSMNVGGRESVVLDILEYLDRDRFDVEVACLSNEGTLYDQFISKNVPIYFFRKKAGFKPQIYIQLYRHFVKKHYHIVHSHNPGAFLYSALGAKLAKTPVIINSEHGYGNVISWRKKIAESILTNKISQTLAVSKELCGKLSNRPFVKKDKVQVLYNGVDIEKYNSSKNRNEIRESLGIQNSQILVGTVGRLSVVKDHKTLIRGFKIFHDTIPHSKLVIVGEGDQREQLNNLVKRLGLYDDMIFTGERNDIPLLLSGMDIFVLSSLSEGISITLLEAMAAGLPVVATSVGGNLEVVEDDLSGLIVPSRNPKKIADAILKILQDSKVCRYLGGAAKERVREKFNIKQIIRELETIYESFLLGRVGKLNGLKSCI